MAEEILGIASHMDISDIDRAITEIIDNLDKIGVKTDVLSKRMSEAMREIASSTDDAATKQKRAMDVYSQAIAEVKAAMTGYPDALRQAKNEADATAQATARLESQLAKMNEKLNAAKEGTDAYNKLKRDISGIEQQITSNTRAYEAQVATIQKMEAGYNSLVQLYGVADAAVLANATAHGLTATTTTAEAGAHTKNAVEIEKETQAVKQAKEMTVEAANANKVFVSSKEEALKVVTQLVQKFHDLRDAGAASDKILAAQSEAMRAIDNYANYGLDRKDFDLSLEKSKAQAINEQSEAINKKAQATEKAEQATEKSVKAEKTRVEELTDALAKAEEKYRNMLGLSENSGKLSTLWAEHKVAEQVNNGVISQGELQRILEAREAVIKLKDELKEAKKEATTGNEGEQNKLVTMAHNFKEQWSYVGELKDKIRGLTQELGQCEAEYSKLAGKSNFDEDSKKVKELEEQIQSLKNQIADANKELDQMPNSAGSVLAKWKEKLVDFLTGGGKFQASLSNMKTALGGLLAPLTAATGGVMAMTRALFAMAATPIGAVLSGIVLALQALFAWFKKSAEGQTAFAQITAYLGSIMSSLMDVAVKIGKYLFKAFTDPQTAVHAFGVNLVKMVIEPIKVIINLLQSLGSAISGVVYSMAAIKSDSWEDFHHYLDKATESFKNAERTFTAAGEAVANTIQNAYNGVINLVKSVGEVSQDVWDKTRDVDLTAYFSQQLKKAQESAQLAKQQIEAQKQLSEAKRDEKLLDIEIAKEREKIYMLTGKEKDAQIEKVKQMLKERYKPQIEAQEKLYEIQARRNKLHTASLEQLAQEREAQGAIYQLQAQQAASTRMLVRMQQANLRKMENEGKQANKKDTAVQEATTNWEETVRKNSYARARAEEQIQNAITDARIAAMKDGTEKVLAEKNRAFEKELEQLDEQRKAAIEAEYARQKAEFEAQEKIIKARGGKPEQWNADKVDKSAIDAINAQYNTLKELASQRHRNDDLRQETQNWREYLKAYGNMQEKKLAITQEFEEKINAEIDPSKKAMLMMQFEEELAKLNTQQIMQDINWDAIFQDIMNYDVKYLNSIEKQLEAAIKDGIEKGIDAADLKVFADKLQEVRNAIVQKSGGIFGSNGIFGGSWMGDIKSQLQNRQMLQMRAQTLRSESNRLSMQAALANSAKNNAYEEWQNAIKVFGENSKEAADAQAKFSVASSKAERAQLLFTKTSKEAVAAEKAAEGSSGQMALAITDAIIHGVNDNLQSAKTMVEEWGIGDKDFQEKFAKFAESSQYATQAFDALKNGDIAGVIFNIGNAFSALGESFGVWSNSNRAETEEENKKLQNAIMFNTAAIDRLTEAMKNATPEEAYKYKEQAVAAKRASEEAERQRLINNAYMYDGGHSLNDDIITTFRGFGENLVKMIFQKVGKTSTTGQYDLGDLLRTLSAEDWNTLMRDEEGRILLATLQSIITKAEDEGNYNGLMQDILNFASTYSKEAYDEIENMFKESVTGTSLDAFKNKFKSELMDMKKDAKSFADDFTEMLTQSILNAQIEKLFGEEIQDLYNAWSEAFDDGVVTDEEIRKLQQWQDDLTQRMITLRDSVASATGYDKVGSQSATANSIQNISYDQADALEGILFAHTIILENTLSEVSTQTGMIGNIDLNVQNINAQVVDIRSGVFTIIETQTNMNSHLAQISQNTRVLPDMYDEIIRVRKAVE